MSSLVHQKVATVPDDPLYEVGSSEWNEAHVMLGAGPGELVYVDGAGQAATSADFTFDDGTKVLRVGGVAGTAVDVGEYGVFRWSYEDGTPAMQIVQEAEFDGFSGEALGVRDGAGTGGGILLLASFVSASNWQGALFGQFSGGDFGIIGQCDTTNQTQAPAIKLKTNSFDLTVTSIGLSNQGAGIEFTINDALVELDADGFYQIAAGKSLGIVGFPWDSVNANGYKSGGTAGITGTMTAASLTGKTLTFTNGLVTGFA